MCLSPITITVQPKDGGKAYKQPVCCGKCTECIAQRTQQWRARLFMESTVKRQLIYFGTFTHSDDDLPTITFNGIKYPVPSKRYVQNINKKVRIFIQRRKLDITFKYFICSEYGPQTFRPHYHGLFFVTGKDKKLFKEIYLNAWPCLIKSLDLCLNKRKSISYVCNYVTTRFGNPYFCNDDFDTTQFNCWYLFSNNLGRLYKDKAEKNILNNLAILKQEQPHIQKLINILSIVNHYIVAVQ